MNILHVLPWESFGGVPNYVRGLLKGLKILGHRNVCVGLDLCFKAYRRYCDVYVAIEDRLHKIPRTIKIYLHQVFKPDFSHVLGEIDVDSVIINNDPRVIPLNDVVKSGIPIIRVQHGTYMNYLYWYRHLPVPAIDRVKGLSHTLLYHYDILRYLRKASRLYPNFYVVAVSEHTRKELIYYGVPSNKIYVVTGGVDKDIFKPLFFSNFCSIQGKFHKNYRFSISIGNTPSSPSQCHVHNFFRSSFSSWYITLFPLGYLPILTMKTT